MNKSKKISIVTTCMNRLEHLKISLPSFLNQSYAEIIVVDYGCSQGTADYLEANYPNVLVIKVDNILTFNLSKARNIGANIASNEILFFCDADVILQVDFGVWASKNFKDDNFYITPAIGPGRFGNVLVGRQFFNAQRYDEAFDFWGGEDRELYERLEFMGLTKSTYPSEFILPIDHSDGLRQLDKALPSKQEHIKICDLYREIKHDIMKLEGVNLTIEARTNLMRQVKNIFQSSKDRSIEIESNARNNRLLKIKKKIKYIIE